MTLLVGLLVAWLALVAGVIVGCRRGAIAGITVGLGVFMAGSIGYFGLFAVVLPR